MFLKRLALEDNSMIKISVRGLAVDSIDDLKVIIEDRAQDRMKPPVMSNHLRAFAKEFV